MRGSLLGSSEDSFLYQVMFGLGIPVVVHWNVTGASSLMMYSCCEEFMLDVTAEIRNIMTINKTVIQTDRE